MGLAMAAAVLVSVLAQTARAPAAQLAAVELEVNRLAAAPAAFPVVEQPASGLRFSWRIGCRCGGGGGDEGACCRGQRVETYRLLVRDARTCILGDGIASEETTTIRADMTGHVSKGGATSHVLASSAGLLTQLYPRDSGVSCTGPLGTPSRTPWTLSRSGKCHRKRARTSARTFKARL
jgi:hypothetical protein